MEQLHKKHTLAELSNLKIALFNTTRCDSLVNYLSLLKQIRELELICNDAMVYNYKNTEFIDSRFNKLSEEAVFYILENM